MAGNRQFLVAIQCHANRRLGFAGKQKGEAAKQLGLCPTMHRHVVPAEKEFARPERAIGLLPPSKHVRHDTVDDAIQFRKAAAQKDS